MEIKWTKEDFKAKKGKDLQLLLASFPALEDIYWVGLDPGRKDIAATCDLSRNKKKMSGKAYFKHCKMNERSKWTDAKLEEFEMTQFLRDMPSNKTHHSEATKEYLNYLHSQSDNVNLLFDIKCARNTRHQRWRTYMHRQKTLDTFCNDINKEPNTVIAYGDASFCHASKGYPATLKGNWIRHRLEKVHKAHVLQISEYNTSQICNHCHEHSDNPVKLVGLCSKRDPYRANVKRPIQKHFVRRCTHCRTIWNRDVNASLNMIYLGQCIVAGQDRPQHFSRRLEKPPETRLTF